VRDHNFATSNIVFGMGGALLQQCNRNTFKFAIKCSAINMGGEWKPVFKQPKTDSGKNSKQGRLKLVKKDGQYQTVQIDEPGEDLLREVFRDGAVTKPQTFDSIRAKAARP